MARWGLSQSPDCCFCLNPESLLHFVANCQQYLDRFTWRHDSIRNFIAMSLQPVINVRSSLYANVNGFLNPSIITVENYRPDPLFLNQSKCLYVLELTGGFKSKLNKNIWTWSKKWAEIADVWNSQISPWAPLAFIFLQRMLHVDCTGAMTSRENTPLFSFM